MTEKNIMELKVKYPPGTIVYFMYDCEMRKDKTDKIETITGPVNPRNLYYFSGYTWADGSPHPIIEDSIFDNVEDLDKYRKERISTIMGVNR